MKDILKVFSVHISVPKTFPNFMDCQCTFTLSMRVQTSVELRPALLWTNLV